MIKKIRSRSFWRTAALLFALAALLEGGSAIVCHLGRLFPQANRFVWAPDTHQVRNNWRLDSSQLDLELGGTKPSPVENDPQHPPCGAAYGDSFITGFESEDGIGWVERLSNLLGCRIANYGVGGYGIDQAYLRFQMIHDDAPLVMLGIDPNGIMDVVSQYDAILGSEPVPTALKGRFLLDANEHLKWISVPQLDENGFVSLNLHPADVIPHAYFLPDTADSTIAAHFPFALSLARALLMPSVRNMMLGRTDWGALYQANNPSRALSLMTAISQAFVELAAAHNKRALIVLLPVARSFLEQARFGEFEYAALVAKLRAKNIPVFDAGPSMIANLGSHSTCDLFARQHAFWLWEWILAPVPCGGHYSSFAHSVIAQQVYAEIQHRNLIH